MSTKLGRYPLDLALALVRVVSIYSGNESIKT